MNKFIKPLYKMRYLPLLLVPLLVVMMVLPGTLVAYGPTVDLLTTSNFAVLAGASITNVPTTNIYGDAGVDIGVSPGSSIDGGIVLNGVGTTHTNDAVAIQAQTDLVTVYNDAAGRTDTAVVPVELGALTLTSGVYSSGGVLQITGTLTLDAQGDPNAVFIFKSTATLDTAAGSSVNLINGARYCRVFWVVPSSATLGANSTFVGHILAMTSITANTGAAIQGQLLARGGSVNLNANTITNGPCPTTTSVYTLTAYTEGNGSITNPGVFVISPGQSLNYTITPDEGYTIADVLVNGISVGAVSSYTFLGVNSNQTIRAIFSEIAIENRTVDTTTTTPVTATISGGQIPKTSTPWHNVLIAGAALILIGAMGWWITRKVHV